MTVFDLASSIVFASGSSVLCQQHLALQTVQSTSTA